jgi:hypothetical protein
MKDFIQKYRFLSSTGGIIRVPLLLYFLWGFSQKNRAERNAVAVNHPFFFLMLEQFYLTRGYRVIRKVGKKSDVERVHKLAVQRIFRDCTLPVMHLVRTCPAGFTPRFAPHWPVQRFRALWPVKRRRVGCSGMLDISCAHRPRQVREESPTV